MYVDFPNGRLKFFGTLVFPANRYLLLRIGKADVACEDVFENMARAVCVCARARTFARGRAAVRGRVR